MLGWVQPPQLNFMTYIKRVGGVNVLLWCLMNGTLLSARSCSRQVKMRMQRGQGPKANSRSREHPPCSTINPVKDLFEHVCACACLRVSYPTFRKVLPNTDPCKVISPPQMALLCVLMATSQTLSSSLPGLPTTHTNTLCPM